MTATTWALQRALLDYLEGTGASRTSGIWEIRGERRSTSRTPVMAWVAMDRAVVPCSATASTARCDAWRAAARAIHARRLRARLRSRRAARSSSATESTRAGREPAADAASWASCPRTTRAWPPRSTRSSASSIVDGLVMRYRSDTDARRPAAGEGAFLALLVLARRRTRVLGARRRRQTLFERLLALRNDVGLLSEEYDPRERRAREFPQALTHTAIITTTTTLSAAEGRAGPAQLRSTISAGNGWDGPYSPS